MQAGVSPPGSSRSRGKLALFALLLCLAPREARGQQFGQWWWYAAAAASGHRVTASSQGGGSSEFGSDRLSARFGIRGFVVHPAIGKFRVDLDASTSRVQGGRSVDSDHLGFEAEVNLLPYGYVPISLFASRGRFGYGDADDGFGLRSAPESQRTWGGQISSQWKALQGLRLRFFDREVDFLDPEFGSEKRQEQELNWSRQFGRVNNTAKLIRRYQDFALGDFTAEDLILSIEQYGRIGERWDWRQSLAGTRREIPLRAGDGTTDNLGFSSQFSRKVRSTDQLRFVVGATRADSLVQEVQSASLVTEYSWRRSRRWTVTPSAGHTQLEIDGEKVSSSQGAVAVAWEWQKRSFSLTVSNRAGYVVLDGGGVESGVADSDSVTYESRISLAGSGPWKLRQQLELSYAHNELSVTRPVDADEIDLGLVVNERLLADVTSARLTLHRKWGRLSGSSNTYWARYENSSRGRASEPPLLQQGVGFQSDSMSQVLQITRNPFDVSASASTAKVSGPGSPEQRSDLLTTSVRWMPRRSLNLYARFRSEDRDTALSPRIDYERIEVGARFAMGLLELEASYFETAHSTESGPQRSNHGYSWQLRRRAGGLLPIVSAPKRRGVIR